MSKKRTIDAFFGAPKSNITKKARTSSPASGVLHHLDEHLEEAEPVS